MSSWIQWINWLCGASNATYLWISQEWTLIVVLCFLPTVYVVWLEGNVFSPVVCPLDGRFLSHDVLGSYPPTPWKDYDQEGLGPYHSLASTYDPHPPQPCPTLGCQYTTTTWTVMGRPWNERLSCLFLFFWVLLFLFLWAIPKLRNPLNAQGASVVICSPVILHLTSLLH